MEVGTEYKKGFSLIELLVVVAIIAIGAALSWKSISDSKKRTQVDNACQSVAVLVNKAKAYALAGVDGSDRIRVSCAGNSCQLQTRCASCTPASSWGPLASESPLTLQGATASLDSGYGIPYSGTIATGTIATGTNPITSSDGTMTKTLITGQSGAVCQ